MEKEQEVLEHLGAELEPDHELEKYAQAYARAFIIAYETLTKRLGSAIKETEFSVVYLAQQIVDAELNHRRIMEHLRLKYENKANMPMHEIIMPGVTEIDPDSDDPIFIGAANDDDEIYSTGHNRTEDDTQEDADD